MSNSLYVGTRKGLLVYERRDGGWRVARTAFVGDPVSTVLPDGRDDTLYAGLNLGHFGVKLHRSDDDGATWTEVGAPQYPKLEGDEAAKGPSVKQLWCLESGRR